MRRKWCASITMALLSLTLSGCDAFVFGPEAKINAAIPLPQEVLFAKSETLEQLPSNQRKEIENEFANRLKLRALTCAKGYSPSWYTTAETIRQMLPDRMCFAEADVAIAKWLGLRRIGLILAKPSLRPVPATPPKYIIGYGFIQTARFADEAGIALFELQQGLQIIDLETGNTIFKEDKSASQPGFLSPNGRLFTWGSESRVKIRSTETGSVIAELAMARAHEFHWLNSKSAVYNRSDTGKALLIDFASGKEIPLTGVQGPIMRAVRVPGSENQFIIGSYRTVSKIEIERNNLEPGVKLIEEKPIIGGIWALNTFGQTADGSRYFNASKELIITSLASLDQDKISFDPFHVQTGIPTPDADKILITGFIQSAPRVGTRHLLYSISEHTLIPIDRSKLTSERFIYIPLLKRMAIITDSKIEVLDALPLGEPITLTKFVGDATEEANLRSLEAAKRQLSLPNTLGPGSSAQDPNIPPGPLTALARDAQIESVGVYQGANSAVRAGEARKTGIVEVRVRRSAKPIILVLSSYEPVRWMLISESGARLAAVLVSGYHPSQVVGAGSARIIMLGSAFAYKNDTPQYSTLDNDVYRLTGKRIFLFQGRYEGAAFSVGGS